MSQNIVIACDSTCDLSPVLLERYGIPVLPLGVSLGDQLYADGVDIDPEMIYGHYTKTGVLPKTCAPNIAEFEEFFRKHTADGKSLVFFTISSEMSSTFATARIAAEEFETVFIVDTRSLSTGGGLLVCAAAEMANAGTSAREIAAACEAMASQVDASFIVDDLEFLHKGGRCSAVAAFGANLLQLKPCIEVHGGKMGVGKKYRGKFPSVLKKYITERLEDGDHIQKDRIFVTHAGCDASIVQACVDQVSALGWFREILVTQAGCTISSHCGRNTLGILFLREQ